MTLSQGRVCQICLRGGLWTDGGKAESLLIDVGSHQFRWKGPIASQRFSPNEKGHFQPLTSCLCCVAALFLKVSLSGLARVRVLMKSSLCCVISITDQGTFPCRSPWRNGECGSCTNNSRSSWTVEGQEMAIHPKDLQKKSKSVVIPTSCHESIAPPNVVDAANQ